jgi:hypothetical protein
MASLLNSEQCSIHLRINFMIRNARMGFIVILSAALALPVICLLGIMCLALWQWPDLWQRHFCGSPPAGTRLVNYVTSRAGYDASYGFEFHVANDQVRDGLIARWGLTAPAPAIAKDRLLSFIDSGDAGWWPADIDAIAEEHYVRIEDQQEKYWSLWVDRDENRIFAVYGNW